LSYGWHVLHVDDGDKYVSIDYISLIVILNSYSDLHGIYNAIEEARKVTDKPTIIRLRTIIGYGSKLQGTHGVHGNRKDD